MSGYTAALSRGQVVADRISSLLDGDDEVALQAYIRTLSPYDIQAVKLVVHEVQQEMLVILLAIAKTLEPTTQVPNDPPPCH